MLIVAMLLALAIVTSVIIVQRPRVPSWAGMNLLDAEVSLLRGTSWTWGVLALVAALPLVLRALDVWRLHAGVDGVLLLDGAVLIGAGAGLWSAESRTAGGALARIVPVVVMIAGAGWFVTGSAA